MKKLNLFKSLVLVAGSGILFYSCSAFATQSDGDFKYAKRYNKAGVLMGEISPVPNSNTQNRPAKRYRYTDPSGADSRTTLLFLVEEGYLTGWEDDTAMPNDWAGFVPTVRTQYTYDSYGRRHTEGQVDSNGDYLTLTQYSYDSRNRIACKAVRMNKSMLSPALLPQNDIENVYSSGACITGAEGSNGPDRITKYIYDSLHNVVEEYRAVGTPLEQLYVKNTYNGYLKTSVTDANGNLATLEYDEEWSRLEKWTFPHKEIPLTTNDNDYEYYTYDLNGNRVTFRKRDGSVFNYQYDALNRMTKKDVPAKPANHPFKEDVFYGYDTQGLQLYAMYGSYSAGSHDSIGNSIEYSGFGEIISEISNVGGSYTVQHSYDLHGNKQSTTYHDGSVFTRSYNNLDDMTGITRGSFPVVNYGYTADGLPEWKTTDGDATTTSLAYDAISRVDNIGFDFSGVAGDLTIGFAYNPASQLIEQNLSSSEYHHMDGLGNLGGYQVNGLNQYTAVNGVTFNWDDNGNLLEDDHADYTYDKENRLVKVVLNDGSGIVADLIYDPSGRLAQYKVDGTTTNFIYDGDVIISEYRTNNSHANYVHSNTIGAPQVVYEYSGSTLTDTLYLHKNHQGSVIAATDTGGNLAQINTYDAYGVAGDLNLGRFGYTGQVWLPEVGLYHYRARAYRAEIGRFLQTDPIGYADNMNLYAYVGNDPMNKIDPFGLAETGGNCGRGDGDSNCGEVTVTATKDGDQSCVGCMNLSGAAAQQYVRNQQSGFGDSGGNNSGTYLGLMGAAATKTQMIGGRAGFTSKGSFRYYSSNFYGNQYIRVHDLTKIGAFSSGATFGASFAVDAYNLQQGNIEFGEFAVNTGFGATTFGGGYFPLVGASFFFTKYFGADVYGGLIDSLINAQSSGIMDAMSYQR